MIKNQRQYHATRKQIALLEGALESSLPQSPSTDSDDGLFREIQQNALRGQLVDLQAEAKEYEDIRSGDVVALDLDSMGDLPRALIAARISSGISQKALAERIGIKEQMIQRYEDGEYASASFSRMKEVAQELNVGIREEVLLPTAGASLDRLFERLEGAGLDRDFVNKRILPLPILSEIESSSDSEGSIDADLSMRAAASAGRIFGFSPAEIFSPGPFALEKEALMTARLKVAVGANERRLTAYAIYARYLANIVLRATNEMEQFQIPSSADECYREIATRYGEVRFETVLKFVWDLGVPVLPLSDSGAFHGALWRVDGRNVIVLKQRIESSSRWLVNLLHELRHANQQPEQPNFGVLEERESLEKWKSSELEEDAVWFALDVALKGQAEELAKVCAQRAKGSVERLKNVVPRLAREAGVDVGVFADFMAFRLDHDGTTNWWGAATNLQPVGDKPLQEALDIFWDRIDPGGLSRTDQAVLTRALSDF
jgi:transcriptional regulator with XRE-family HTH domain